MSIHQCLPALEVDQHSRVHNICAVIIFFNSCYSFICGPFTLDFLFSRKGH